MQMSNLKLTLFEGCNMLCLLKSLPARSWPMHNNVYNNLFPGLTYLTHLSATASVKGGDSS